MDNGSLKRDLNKYDLVNIDTGKIEETNLLPLEASDRRNVLWSRGIKTRQIVHYRNAEHVISDLVRLSNLTR